VVQLKRLTRKRALSFNHEVVVIRYITRYGSAPECARRRLCVVLLNPMGNRGLPICADASSYRTGVNLLSHALMQANKTFPARFFLLALLSMALTPRVQVQQATSKQAPHW
jgi:hypothetical protein